MEQLYATTSYSAQILSRFQIHFGAMLATSHWRTTDSKRSNIYEGMFVSAVADISKAPLFLPRSQCEALHSRNIEL